MVQIQDTVVHFDVFKTAFVCDLATCCGACCVEGDAGAPLEVGEAEQIAQLLPVVEPWLTPEARKVIAQQGVSYIDCEGDRVTSIVDGKDCVFAAHNAEGVCYCTLERAWREGKSNFIKPISCHLYPVRLIRFASFTAVNYHRWEICQCACQLGTQLQVPLYKFLKEPLIRRFGPAWYAELEEVAKALHEQGLV